MCCAKMLQSCATLCNPMDCSPLCNPMDCAWVSPGKNTGVGGIASVFFTARTTWEAQVNYTSIKKINRRN